VGSRYLCSNLWWAEDTQENGNYSISPKVVGALLGKVEA
jgi:hypothetical protein